MKRLLSQVIFFLFLFSSAGGQQTVPEKTGSPKSPAWKVLGPGGGGGVFLPTISPFADNLVLTHCDMGGAYISYNGGTDWRMFNLWTVPDDFKFDPVNPRVIYTATRGSQYSEDRGSGLSMLYRSEDQGRHWAIVYPDMSKIKKTSHLQSEHWLPSEIAAGAFDGSIDKVEIDPTNNQKIYLGLSPLKSYMNRDGSKADTAAAFLVSSSDYGKSWKMMTGLPGQTVKAILPGDTKSGHGEMLVFTDTAGLSISGATGMITPLALPVKKIIVVAAAKNIIYIQSAFKKENGEINGGMFVSKDRGKTWMAVNNGLLNNLAANRLPVFSEGLAACATKPGTAYISITLPLQNNKIGLEETYCIFKTTDTGSHWKPVLLSSKRGYLTENFKGSWLERSFDPGWGGSPINLGVAPGNPDICFAGDNGRGYKTTDGGKNWEQVYSHNNPDGTYSSNGLDVTTCYGVHFDPFDKNHLFVCYTDIGLFHSFDGGKSWSHALSNIPEPWQNTCYQVAFDPKIKGRVWSAWANAHDLPRTKMFGGFGFFHYSGGVAVSYDQGRTWNKSSAGLPGNSICTNILVDASADTNTQTLYVSIFDKGVYKSTDGGKNWEKKNSGLGANLFAWQLREDVKGRVYVLFPRGEKMGKTVDGAIYYSDDKAGTWAKLSLPPEVTGPHDLLIDPGNQDILYVSCWPHLVNGEDDGGGVIKSTDRGMTWAPVFDKSIRVNSAGLDPKMPNRIFINTFQNAAYQSADYGKTWKRVEGYRFKWGQRAIPDIHHPGMLFLTTYGGSVFYGPENQAPGAFKDVENMPDSWW